ncbi:hypothetical protein B0H17DRAFT_1212590 [Mycena rosella]|uniref:DUF6533 domain-containing protein n=1 Tax=Mycena rosella TaxID=1033263 RepID=A0AAD7G2T7_MYCRO|nr:hypothetical protein B0H17DRAFT_1212590 [Mycena rosella]
MSSPMGGLDAETFAWDHRIYRYIFLSGLTVLFYDHLLTLGTEIPTIWLSKLRPSTVWFLGVRYLALVASAAICVFYFGNLSPEVFHHPPSFGVLTLHPPSCSTMERGLEGLLLTQEALVEFTLTLRVFAMYGLNLWISTSMGLVGGVAGGLGLWTVIKYGHPQMLSMPGLTGCHTAIPRDTALRSAYAWLAQFSLDLIVFGLTVYCAYRDRSAIRYVPGSLVERMARDGAMYFGIIVLANLANVLTLFLGDIIIAGILSWWTTSLSVTLICRLMLNLQRAGVGAQRENFESTELTGIHFVEPNAPAQRAQDDGLDSLADV